MTLRAGTLDDIKAIKQIEDMSFSDPWSEESFLSAYRSDFCRFTVADNDGVVGYALISVVCDEVEIMSVAVREDMRRCGIGRALMESSLECAKSLGGAQVFLEVRESNEAARAMYESLGFREYRRIRRYYRNPCEDAIAMHLELASNEQQ